MILRYPSQLGYGPYGHLICTPVSCAVAVSFLVDGWDALSPTRVHSIMAASHRLVASWPEPRMLMLSELLGRIPASAVGFHEIAGLTSANGTMMLGMGEIENLVVQPLSAILQHCARQTQACAVVVTMQDHTTCYLFDAGRIHHHHHHHHHDDPNEEEGGLKNKHFDPLPAALTTSWRLPDIPTEYSGLLLYKNNTPLCSHVCKHRCQEVPCFG